MVAIGSWHTIDADTLPLLALGLVIRSCPRSPEGTNLLSWLSACLETHISLTHMSIPNAPRLSIPSSNPLNQQVGQYQEYSPTTVRFGPPSTSWLDSSSGNQALRHYILLLHRGILSIKAQDQVHHALDQGEKRRDISKYVAVIAGGGS